MSERLNIVVRMGASGGFGQVIGEGMKVVTGGAGDKFPDGFRSINALEEFSEGSISALTGAMIGLASYQLLRNYKGWEYSPKTERRFVIAGTIAGYSSMVLFGVVLHEVLNTPDVKWGPFK